MRLQTIWTHFLLNLMTLGSGEVHQLKYIQYNFMLEYKIHFFTIQSSSIGGVAHLVNFLGTDTLSALVMARYTL